MSPNPGEPGHATEGFTHAICDVCYFRRARERGWAPVPSRVIDDVTSCCYCGLATRGIYVRDDPAAVHGRREGSIGMTTTEATPRCRYAVRFGLTMHTRCDLESGHDGMHAGPGLETCAYQRVAWLPGDRREYVSARTDEHAWEVE